ncbi:holo-ACP synthase [Veillonella rodentium]|uniref:Holo-[acyl-carrier-protein] synthase n=1 Tax=Veillonella rodentium TaxID=248315 RepID=A0A239Z7E0_9FIRM|nr:holo-ACP synthase [Veillonella rodentium]SNV66504.1 Holo-[acyl-carrier-protein] synthase [Veillonella rodentium]
MRLGNDIIEIKRITDAINKSDRFLERLFTEAEIAYCESRNKGKYESYAGIYAAKEAFLKALGTGLRKGSWLDIEIAHDNLGAPFIRLQDVFKEIYDETGYKNILVSISHCQSYAMSTVIFEGD